MPSLSWLMNLGFAGGGAVVSAARRLIATFSRSRIKTSAAVGDYLIGTAFVRRNDELILRNQELISVDK